MLYTFLLLAGRVAYAQENIHPSDIAPHNPLMEGHTIVPPSTDPDGFTYDLSGDLARMDIREIAKGDFYLAQSLVDDAYRCYTIAYEAGNRDKYLLTQLGVVGVIRNDFATAVGFLTKAAAHIKPTALDDILEPPYSHGYKRPDLRRARR